MVSCASQRLNDKYIEREGEKEGRQKQMEWNYEAEKRKYHSITVAIKACRSSITQMYQDIKCLTDVKRVKAHVEMRRDGL